MRIIEMYGSYNEDFNIDSDIFDAAIGNDSKCISYKYKALRQLEKNMRMSSDFFMGGMSIVNSRYFPKAHDECPTRYSLKLKMIPPMSFYIPIIKNIIGILTKREPVCKGLEDFYLNDIDLHGNSFEIFYKRISEGSLLYGGHFVAVEYDIESNRPYCKEYKYENLLNFKLNERTNKLEEITFLIKKSEIISSEFSKYDCYMVFTKKKYTKYFKNKDDNIVEIYTMEHPCDEIPVVFINSGIEKDNFIVSPQLLNILYLNLSLLQTYSAFTNLIILTTNPTPIIFDSQKVLFDNNKKNMINLSLHKAMVLSDRQHDSFEYSNLNGESMPNILKHLEGIKELIIEASSGLLSKNTNNTIVGAQDNFNKSSSFLSLFSEELETKTNKLFFLMAKYKGISIKKNMLVEFKKDLDDILYSDKSIDILHKMLVSGDLTRRTMWKQMKIMGILTKSFDIDSEEEELKNSVNPFED